MFGSQDKAMPEMRKHFEGMAPGPCEVIKNVNKFPDVAERLPRGRGAGMNLPPDPSLMLKLLPEASP